MLEKWSKQQYQEYLKTNGNKSQKPRKYRNTPVSWRGELGGRMERITFDSKKERDRFIVLRIMRRNGEIKNLQIQKRFLLLPATKSDHPERPAHYTADFFYYDVELGKWVIEDTKSEITKKEPAYILRRKIIKQKYPQFLFKET